MRREVINDAPSRRHRRRGELLLLSLPPRPPRLPELLEAKVTASPAASPAASSAVSRAPSLAGKGLLVPASVVMVI